MHADTLDRPRLRGVSHQFAFFVAIGAGAVLVATTASLAIAVYAITLAQMLGVSASYHRGSWRPAARRRWKRADHASIFVFIAGTYTPICSTRLLVIVWIGAALGALRALLWVDAPRWLSALLYVGLGWLVIGELPAVAAAGTGVLVLLAAGGLLYTLGAIVYALRWPDPSPRVFGYHEVFHAFVIGAVLCHFAAVVLLTATSRT